MKPGSRCFPDHYILPRRVIVPLSGMGAALGWGSLNRHAPGRPRMTIQAKLLCAVAVSGFAALMFPSQSWAQAKTAKACTEEWRADKAGFQAKGITEKAYVAECRSGGAATPTAAAPAPVAPAPTAAPTPSTDGQPKTAKACVQEWRAD